MNHPSRKFDISSLDLPRQFAESKSVRERADILFRIEKEVYPFHRHHDEYAVVLCTGRHHFLLHNYVLCFLDDAKKMCMLARIAITMESINCFKLLLQMVAKGSSSVRQVLYFIACSRTFSELPKNSPFRYELRKTFVKCPDARAFALLKRHARLHDLRPASIEYVDSILKIDALTVREIVTNSPCLRLAGEIIRSRNIDLVDLVNKADTSEYQDILRRIIKTQE